MEKQRGRKPVAEETVDLSTRVAAEVGAVLDEHRGLGSRAAAVRAVLTWWSTLPKRERQRAIEEGAR